MISIYLENSMSFHRAICIPCLLLLFSLLQRIINLVVHHKWKDDENCYKCKGRKERERREGGQEGEGERGGWAITILFLKRRTDRKFRSTSKKQQFWLVSLNGSWKCPWFDASWKLWSWSLCSFWPFFTSTSTQLKLSVRTRLKLRGTCTAQNGLPGLSSSSAHSVLLFRKAFLTPQWGPSTAAHFWILPAMYNRSTLFIMLPPIIPSENTFLDSPSKNLLLLEFPGQELEPLALWRLCGTVTF